MSSDFKTQRFTDEQRNAAELEIAEKAKRIEYFITEWSVEILARNTHHKEYVIPDYQREYTWDEGRKWRFIESILIGLPIPFVFFWEDPSTGKLEIVDGSQRLRTLAEFIHGELELHELVKLPLLEGFRFADLTEARQRKFMNRSIRGIVLNEHTDPESRFDLFERINTGSKAANKAEIRRGALRGPFLDLVIELSKEPLFIQLAPVTEKQLQEREREELVTRFFAYGDGLDEYADEVSPFLYAYAQRMNDAFVADPALVDQLRKSFLDVMRFAEAGYPNGFRKTARAKVTPRVRFEALAIGARLALAEEPGLKPDSARNAIWMESAEFMEITRSDAANVRSKLVGRMEFVKRMLLSQEQK